MKKVGVLTFHRCINYGAYWQARCLVEHLADRGFQVKLLNHLSRRSVLAEWRHLVLPDRPVHDLGRNLLKILRFLLAQHRLPRTPRFSPERAPQFEDLDCVLVGSDEVWNLVHPWYGNHPIFFGEGLKPRRLVAYAPSFGNYQAAKGLPLELRSRLRRFNRISVRDQNSADLVRDALQVEPPLVLDPCLQFSPAAFRQKPDANRRRFLLVYASDFSPSFVADIRRWARSRALRIVSIGHRLPWADVNLASAGPEQFLRCFVNAQAVVTSFFHGCVFSLRFGRPFVTQIPDYRANKVRGLLSLAGVSDRLHHPEESLRATLLDTPPSPAVLARIDEFRRQSFHYLDEALAI